LRAYPLAGQDVSSREQNRDIHFFAKKALDVLKTAMKMA